MIEAKVIADSVSPDRKRLTTLQLTYPRFIHSELMTHRVFSRNASSSRAIPVQKMIEQVRSDPAMPIYWGVNKPGMQAGTELAGASLRDAKSRWLEAAQAAADVAERMMEIGLHKQVSNRILEPFQWMHTIVSATEWDNFFELRLHPDAQPEIQALAQAMKAAMDASTPQRLQIGEWHLPYVNAREREQIDIDTLIKCSVARCARVSFLNHDGTSPDAKKDAELYQRLVGSRPIHASPAEHVATPDRCFDDWVHPWEHGNFVGWCQHRKMIEQCAWSE